MGSHSIATYTEVIDSIDKEAYDRILDEANSYNNDLISDPGRFTPSEDDHNHYESILSVDGSDVMGSIQIPSVKITLPIYHGTSDSVLEVGAGHLEGSSLPIGGTGTHAVITGHRGLPSAKLFTDLDKVVEGDYVVIHILNETLTYQVNQIRIVEPSEIEQLKIEPDKDQLTLVTCTPYGINTHRILITGQRVDNLPENYQGDSEAKLVDSKMVALFIAIPILIALFIWLLIRYRNPKTRDESED